MTLLGATRRAAPRIDPLELGLAADPYPAYARIREAGALVAAGPGTWAVGRHADVAALLRDPRLSHRFPDAYREFAVGAGATRDLLQRIVSSREPPAHTAARERLRAALDGAASTAWWRWARCRVDARVRALTCAGPFDAVGDLAAPLALDLVCHLYDLHGADRATVAGAAPALGRAFTALRLSAADRVAADAAVTRCRALFATVPAGGPDGPGPRGVLALGAPGEDTWVDDAVFLCFTAVEMMTSAVATCVATLLPRPELARLRADPSLVETAVAELLRFDAPTQGTARLVVEPIEVDGQRVRPGRTLFLLLGSANRDERVFADPDRLDPGRTPNPHLSFGGGPYRCLGAAMATRLCALVLGSLLRHTSALEPHAAAVRYPASTFCRSYSRVPVSARAV